MNQIEKLYSISNESKKAYKKAKKEYEADRQNLSDALLPIHNYFVEKDYYKVLFYDNKSLSDIFSIIKNEFPYRYLGEGDYKKINFSANAHTVNIILSYNYNNGYSVNIIAFDVNKIYDANYIQETIDKYTVDRNAMLEQKQKSIEEEEKEQLKYLKTKYE